MGALGDSSRFCAKWNSSYYCGSITSKEKEISSRNLPMEYTDLGGAPKIDVFGWVGLHIDKKWGKKTKERKKMEVKN